MRFQDQGVLVTGAASGIGRQLAIAFAEEGARLAIADIDKAAVEATAAEVTVAGESGGGGGSSSRCRTCWTRKQTGSSW